MTTPRPRPATVTARIEDTSHADTTPADFFEPGARYYDGDPYKAPEQTHTFQCEHVATHPRPGAGPRAFGFQRNNAPDSDWISTALREADFDGWTRLPDAHTTSTHDANDTPAPGREHPFSISDIARATARLLGDDWTAKSGSWGTVGTLAGPYSTKFTFSIDHEDDLVIDYRYSTDDDFPEDPELPEGTVKCDAGVYLESASAADGLDSLAERSAAAIRAITTS
ncbi:hypothetical protein OG613_49125 (plasmid) [Streptomyces sp. NBC_00015]|uniref:hypothetical protein n=1 Tax=Streptomyces sp. NBC_00015 TaxID=2903611 RepID=UPI002F90B3AF